MLRSFHRATLSSTFLGGPSIRTNIRSSPVLSATCLQRVRPQQKRHSTAPPTTTSNPASHPISNPTLVDIEKRWCPMPPEEQAELWMALRDRMKNDWHDLSFQERKAGKSAGIVPLAFSWEFALNCMSYNCVKKMSYFFASFFILHRLTASWSVAYFIAFGPHGPRAEPPPGVGWWYFKWTFAAFAFSGVLLIIIRSFAGPPPSTMNKEWQEATNEYLKVIFTSSHGGCYPPLPPSKPKTTQISIINA